jgi:hypothetical protein
MLRAAVAARTATLLLLRSPSAPTGPVIQVPSLTRARAFSVSPVAAAAAGECVSKKPRIARLFCSCVRTRTAAPRRPPFIPIRMGQMQLVMGLVAK